MHYIEHEILPPPQEIIEYVEVLVPVYEPYPEPRPIVHPPRPPRKEKRPDIILVPYEEPVVIKHPVHPEHPRIPEHPEIPEQPKIPKIPKQPKIPEKIPEIPE